MLLKRFLLLLRPPLENIALIDGQNLQLGTTKSAHPWVVDLRRLHVYLRDKYHVAKAYYFIGAYDSRYEKLYNAISRAGYILIFRKHTSSSLSKKKGNVDTDIVFMMMRECYKNHRLDKIYLISGDGDYFRTVEFLIQERHFGKMLLPSHKNASALYQKISHIYRDYLDRPQIKSKIIRNQ